MLIRKVKTGDCLTIGGVVIVVRKVTGENLKLAIQAPADTQIKHARGGDIIPDCGDAAPA
jgi:sRNA-binding carbon storage regulator CsrA